MGRPPRGSCSTSPTASDRRARSSTSATIASSLPSGWRTRCGLPPGSPPTRRGRRCVASIVRSVAAGVAAVVDELRTIRPVESSRSSAAAQPRLSSSARSRRLPAFGSFPARWKRPPSATRSCRASRSAGSRASVTLVPGRLPSLRPSAKRLRRASATARSIAIRFCSCRQAGERRARSSLRMAMSTRTRPYIGAFLRSTGELAIPLLCRDARPRTSGVHPDSSLISPVSGCVGDCAPPRRVRPRRP